jgi:hypothetical protein
VESIRGTVVSAGRFGAVVRLDDGRIATVAADEPSFQTVRHALAERRRPAFDFIVLDELRGRARVILASERGSAAAFEQKIADYLRQTAEWDPRGAASDLRPAKVDRHARKRDRG